MKSGFLLCRPIRINLNWSLENPQKGQAPCSFKEIPGPGMAADEVFDLLPTRLYGRFKAESGIFFTLGALDMRYDSQNTRHPLKITFFDTLQVSFR